MTIPRPRWACAFTELDDFDVPYVVVKRFRNPEGAPQWAVPP